MSGKFIPGTLVFPVFQTRDQAFPGMFRVLGKCLLVRLGLVMGLQWGTFMVYHELRMEVKRKPSNRPENSARSSLFIHYVRRGENLSGKRT